MTHYVNGFYTDGQRVALIRKAKPKWQAGRLNGVGGKIEEGETPVQAMVREFREETAQQTVAADWKHAVTLTGADFTVYFFAAFGPPFDYDPSRCDGNGIEPIEWWDAADLPSAAIYNLNWLIPLCWDSDLKFPIELVDRSNPELDGMTARDN